MVHADAGNGNGVQLPDRDGANFENGAKSLWVVIVYLACANIEAVTACVSSGGHMLAVHWAGAPRTLGWRASGAA